MRTLEDGPCTDSEIYLAFVAAIEAALAGRDAILAAASRADNAVRPKPCFKINPRCFRVWNQLEEFKGAYCALAHVCIVVNSLEGVKYYFEEYVFSCIWLGSG